MLTACVTPSCTKSCQTKHAWAVPGFINPCVTHSVCCLEPSCCVYATAQVLNKVDLLTPAQLEQATAWLQANTGAAAVLPTAALGGDGIDGVRQWAVKQLPLGPTLYPKVKLFTLSTVHCGMCAFAAPVAVAAAAAVASYALDAPSKFV